MLTYVDSLPWRELAVLVEQAKDKYWEAIRHREADPSDRELERDVAYQYQELRQIKFELAYAKYRENVPDNEGQW